jgi:tetratricopeptide (TPR) repeat protein
MARSGARRKTEARPQVNRRQAARASREDVRAAEAGMFFPKLRTSAKWVFVFLAMTFALGFVVFGVGSGNGTGLGDLISGGSSSSGPSVGDAQDKIDKNPNDAAAYHELGTALSNEGRQDEAIAALTKYVTLRSKDVNAKRELAGLYEGKAATLRNEAQQIQSDAAGGSAGAQFSLPQTSKLGQALGPGKVEQEVQNLANTKLTDAYTGITEAYTKAAALYEQVVATHPDDEALLQLALGDAAYQARNTPLAVKAYKRFVKLAPDDPSAPYARQQIKQAQAGAGNAVPIQPSG